MDTARIAELLAPFLASSPPVRPNPAPLAPSQLEQISIYIDLLLRWNARINLTAVRRPEDIVTRHFGESLFAARHLFPSPHAGSPAAQSRQAQAEVGYSTSPPCVVDIGSGAGFPGLPIKIWAPLVRLTLIEANHKKATFLRELIRALASTDTNVFCGRAQDFRATVATAAPQSATPKVPAADVVTLRAVEHFDAILPVAARLLAPAGRLALLIGESQIRRAHELLPALTWNDPIAIPLSAERVLAVGAAAPEK